MSRFSFLVPDAQECEESKSDRVEELKMTSLGHWKGNGLQYSGTKTASGLRNEESSEMRSLKIVIEQHEDGYVAYPVGLDGVVVGEGVTAEAALTDVRSAIQFHVTTFGQGALRDLPQEVILADVELAG
jgi:predicted RNase H-like HicB family nuclease